MSDLGAAFRFHHGVILGAVALLAALTWPGAQGDLLFWSYQVLLMAVLLAGQEFRQSYFMPGDDGHWGAADRVQLALVQGTFFAALMLILQAQGALLAPMAWVMGSLLGGAVFGALATLPMLFTAMRAPERQADFNRRSNRMADRRERIRLYLMPVLLIGVAPLFITEAGLLAPETGLPIYLLFAAAVAEPAPKFPRTEQAEAGALWTLRRHLVLKLVTIGALVVVLIA